MAKHSSKSRLKEVDFSSFNLRDAYVTDNVDYLATLRDEALFSNWGIKALIRVPANGEDIADNQVDEYSNFVDIEWIDTVESIIPKFNDYRINVSDEGMTADGTTGVYPLEVAIPSKLYLPRNSRIVLSEHDAYANKIAREWVVLSTQMKQLSGSKTYSQIADCVPARRETYNVTNTDYLGEFWFDYEVNSVVKADDIRAQGIIWFLRDGVPRDKLVIGKRYEEIFEQLDYMNGYSEYVRVPVYYDNRSQHIVSAGKGFVLNKSYDLIDKNGNPLYVVVDDSENIKVKFTIRPTSVSETGELLGYKFNVERGYTLFGTDGTLRVGVKNDVENAEIDIRCEDINVAMYQETILTPKISSPKYIYPENKIAKISAKNILISVLN